MQLGQATFGSSFWRSAGNLLLALGSLLAASGENAHCQSPQPPAGEPTAADSKSPDDEEQQERKAPLEIGRLVPRFGEEFVDVQAGEGPRIALKPGHWTSVWQRMQANFNDFIGDLNIDLLDENGRPVALEHTRFGLRIARDVPLARGVQRESDVELLLPQRSSATQLRVRLVDRDTGAEAFLYQPKIDAIAAYQYHMVVLAKEPAQYAYLKVTNTVRAPWEEEFEESSQVHYQVTLAKAGVDVPVPENALAWTSVAYLLWDEVDPSRFSIDQQHALLDWIHWGGRLIIDGPDSLASLEGSFLDAVLPATDAGPRTIAAEELAGWSAFWARRSAGAAIRPLAPKRPFSGIELQRRPAATQVAGGDGLFLQRNVGRGSVVVSGVRLTERELIDWPGFDGFLNAGLLDRPRRVFAAGPYGAIKVDWADFPAHRLDAHFTTPLRVFARDAQSAANTQRITQTNNAPFAMTTETSVLTVDRPGGVAAWDEFSPAANAARETLLVAAGVKVPGVGFVIGCLAFYLLVLVPVNWLVFHTLERVEWAWIAAPLIAIGGTWMVVKQAQLDIGFVRAQTELSILELQGPYNRGWLSRFTAMYSSLSTTYEIEFPDHQSAAVLPFPASDTDQSGWQEAVVFHQSGSPRLTGLTVSSSATRLVHGEQLVQLEGPVRLGVSSLGLKQLENRSQLKLRDAAIIRRSIDSQGKPQYDGCWLGEIAPRSSAVVGMKRLGWDAKELPFAADRALAAAHRTAPAMNVDPVLQLAYQFADKHDPLNAQREETRLVAVVDEVLPGMNVTPEASQRSGATVVIAHLEFGPLPARGPDVNSPSDVIVTTDNSAEPL